MVKKRDRKKILLCTFVSGIIVIAIVLLKAHEPLTVFPLQLVPRLEPSEVYTKAQPDGSCATPSDCPSAHLSFYLQTGAANIVAPKICIQNKLVLGAGLMNAGVGINIAIINGKTGDVVNMGNFDMYSGEVKPLIDFLKSVEAGSIVLMVSYDEPASKLNDEARQLIADLGSSLIRSLGFRDNWLFVGGKGTIVKSNFEKLLKNDNAHNKYEGWPELIDLQGCIPQF
uniref:protein FAM3C-like n=1 Tax=Solea senegalensis TaxID=28829 RepID=UPI001CD8E66F|nr:protein FAM3C-like [Solea senegalensis]XP_043891929.1 protein FAM3C-like [Solea senegalensis]